MGTLAGFRAFIRWLASVRLSGMGARVSRNGQTRMGARHGYGRVLECGGCGCGCGVMVMATQQQAGQQRAPGSVMGQRVETRGSLLCAPGPLPPAACVSTCQHRRLVNASQPDDSARGLGITWQGRYAVGRERSLADEKEMKLSNATQDTDKWPTTQNQTMLSVLW
jgi:hypothetical protein